MKRAFEDRVVVVTGATGALGFAVVELLLAEGARCRVPVRRAEKAERLRALDPKRVEVAGGIDFASEESLGAFYRGLPSLWASIHCAGGFTMAPIAESSLADYRALMAGNADTAFLCCVAAVRKMQANAPALEGIGRIVNVAAMAALDSKLGAGKSAYAASKAAVVSLTQTIAAELGKTGLFVNAVAPSILDTPANRAAMPSADHAAWPKVAEVARTILELASPDNRTVNGAIVPVPGRT